MSNVTWGAPGTGGNWGTTSNWTGLAGGETFPGNTPANADAVTLGPGGNSANYVVTFNVASASIGSLTVTGRTSGLTATTTLQMSTGDTLTTSGAITLSNTKSIIDGAGTISEGGAIGGSGTISAGTSSAGGTLDLTGAGSLSSGVVLTIGSFAATTLEIDLAGGATSAAAITISNANQTLEIGPSGTLTIGAAQNVTLGKIQLAGGSLTDSSGISFGTTASSGSLSGFGTVTGALTKSGTSTADTITATGGTLTLATTLGANSGLVFDIGNSASSVLKLSTVPGTGDTFTFLGSAGDLALSSSATFKDAVVGMNVGTSLTPTNFVDILGSTVTVSSGNSGTGTSGTVTLSNGAQLNLSGITNSSGTWFANAKSDGAGGTDIFLSTVCFAAGTRILTGTGERMVESLLAGDIVLTLSGGEFGASPVKWIGRRRIDLTAHPRPETIAPVRIRRGAFADNMPHADLLVSPDHAIFVDGKLICARQLVNGTTILQEQGWTSVDYYHVELDAHAILLAEGLATESYLDTGNRGFFGNSDEALILHPDLTDESDYPAREVGSCAPFVSHEADVLPVWQRLADRAAALGQPVPQLETTTDPGPRLFAKGRTVKPMYGENGLYIFALPKGANEVRLVSRSAAPTDARPWLEDRRRLGLYVERIVLRGTDTVHEVPVDHPSLTRGWWAVESGGTALRRWTDGNAVLPLPVMDGPIMLELRATNAGVGYPLNADQVSAAA